MLKLKIALIITAIYLLFMSGGVFLVHGWFVSDATQSKYERNLDKYFPYHEGHISLKGLDERDSLTFMASHAFWYVTPFSKWYVSDVGVIPRWSSLSKKLDSMAALYVEPSNKYK